MDYIPLDEISISEMLTSIGVKSIDDLYQDIPESIRLDKLNLPKGLPEPNVVSILKEIAEKNKKYKTSFLGAGAYNHYIPAIIDSIISRSEFYTSYTPYQAEASQGFLQVIYEYQTAMSHLTKMDATNASMYDGATAMAEAAIMAFTITRKKTIIALDTIHPHYLDVIKTYCWGRGLTLKIISLSDLIESIDNNTAAVLIQSPTFFGDILDLKEFVPKIREKNPKVMVVLGMTDPTALGILTPPGDLDIDIFVAEGSSFGIPMSFGGPGLGIFSTKKKYIRKMPGRLVGKTRELFGEGEGFILTLQAREQHIRREKASSNICSNEALTMFMALLYVITMGKDGLRKIAIQNIQRANYLKDELGKIEGYKIKNKGPIYNEFVIEVPNIDALIDKCYENKILPPLKLDKFYKSRESEILVCVTELNSKENMDLFINIAKEAL